VKPCSDEPKGKACSHEPKCPDGWVFDQTKEIPVTDQDEWDEKALLLCWTENCPGPGKCASCKRIAAALRDAHWKGARFGIKRTMDLFREKVAAIEAAALDGGGR
jgi:hypothetical protein